jgi:hypothetical protein
LVRWSISQLVRWSNGQLVNWSDGQLVNWSNGQLVPPSVRARLHAGIWAVGRVRPFRTS